MARGDPTTLAMEADGCQEGTGNQRQAELIDCSTRTSIAVGNGEKDVRLLAKTAIAPAN